MLPSTSFTVRRTAQEEANLVATDLRTPPAPGATRPPAATIPPLDVDALRAQFPLLQQVNERGQRLVYLDSAASSQKPAVVLDAVDHYYRTSNANIHRGVYALSEAATTAYEHARTVIAAFLGASDPACCLMVRNTTEALNLVAQSWGRSTLQPGDLVVTTLLDHHANLVPWQQITTERGARLAYVRVTPDGRLDAEHFQELLARRPKLVALTHVSNALGTLVDVAHWAGQAKAAGAVVVLDGAQSAPHLPIAVETLGADFFACSGHKLLGPMGSSVLWGRRALLEAMPPFLTGGGMIQSVTTEGATWAPLPAKFEAGTPAVGETVGFGVALSYLQQLGMDRVREHERELTAYALSRLRTVPGLTLHGPGDADAQAGVVSFSLAGLDPSAVAQALDADNIAVRAGMHCCHPLMRALGLTGIIRASFSVYNDAADVDRLVAGLERAERTLAGRPAPVFNAGNPCGRPEA